MAKDFISVKNIAELMGSRVCPQQGRFTQAELERYRADPVEYAEQELKIFTLTPVQKDILRSLVIPPYRTMVKSGHSVGKTMVAAVAVNWRYDCFDPGVVISTAPTDRDVKDLLWAEIRAQRLAAGLPMDFIGDVAPEMRTGPQHYAKGYTARGGVSFQGRHPEYLFFVFDEAMGVANPFWVSTETMFKSDPEHGWLVIFNPTDVTSIAYQEEGKGELVNKHTGLPTLSDDPDAEFKSKWNVFTMSALDHPNITGEGAQIKAAVSMSQVDTWVKDWCDPLRPQDEHLATDIEWPLGSNRWWRPGPEFMSRVQGVWPSEGTTSVWKDSLWEVCAKPILAATFPLDEWPVLGVDLSNTSGVTAMHDRWGPYSLRHLEANGWSGPRKKGEVIQRCRELAELVNRAMEQAGRQTRCVPTQIRVNIDDAVGGRDLVGHLQEAGYNACSINASTVDGVDLRKYPKMRSMLWFQTVKKAEAGFVKFGLLPKRQIVELKLQAMAPEWQLDGAGRRVVEEKPRTEERLGRSPDGLDAANLCWHDTNFVAPSAIDVQRLTVQERFAQQHDEQPQVYGHGPMMGRTRRGIFGQGR
jgi:hypothetical protein